MQHRYHHIVIIPDLAILSKKKKNTHTLCIVFVPCRDERGHGNRGIHHDENDSSFPHSPVHTVDGGRVIVKAFKTAKSDGLRANIVVGTSQKQLLFTTE